MLAPAAACLRLGVVDLEQGVDGDGAAVDQDQWVEVGRTDAGLLLADPGEARRARRRVPARSTAGSPAERAEEPLGRQVVDHLAGVDLGRWAPGGSPRRGWPRRGCRPTPSMTVRPNCGSSRVRRSARGCRRPWSRPAPRRRRRRAGRHRAGRRRRARERGLVGEAEPHESSLGLVGDRPTAQLGDDGDTRPWGRPATAAMTSSVLGPGDEGRHGDPVSGHDTARFGFGKGAAHGRGSSRPRGSDRRSPSERRTTVMADRPRFALPARRATTTTCCDVRIDRVDGATP